MIVGERTALTERAMETVHKYRNGDDDDDEDMTETG